MDHSVYDKRKYPIVDVREGYESLDKARDIYGVVFTGNVDDDSLSVDEAATATRRTALAAAAASVR